MPFADIFSGFEGAAADHFSKLLEMQYGQRRDAAASIAKMADDPRFDEASSMALKHRALDIIGGDPMKPLSSKDTDISQILVQPPAPPKQQVPGGTMQGATSQGIPQALAPQMNLQPGSFQPPTPPPQPLGMLPFPQQIERERQKSLASVGMMKETFWKPEPGQGFAQDMPDGKRHKIDVQSRLNPDTGQQEWRHVDLGELANFAPRMGDPVTLADAKVFQKEGFPFKTREGQDLDLDQMIALEGPNGMIRNLGNYYGPMTVKSMITRANNEVTAINPYAPGAPGTNLGQAQVPVETTRQDVVPLPGGKLGTLPVTSTRTPLPPQAPPGQPGAAAPQAPTPPPIAGMPDLTQGPTPDAVRFVMSQNKNLTQAQVESALRQNQKSSGAAPAPPTPPPGPQAKPAAGVTPVPGAGRGLSAEQLMQTGQKAEAYQNTVERAVGLLQGFSDPKMRSILERAKLHIVTSPDSGIKLVLGNLATLTPQETKMASDFVSLSEDVNVLRSMYGATGFRSKEALAVLLGQRGELLENPQVFSGVLKNTLQSIVSQLEPIVSQLAENGKPVTITPAMVTAYKTLNNNDAATARQKALAAKYQLPQ